VDNPTPSATVATVAGDDTAVGDGPTLLERLTDAIDKWVWHRNGPHDAAVRVLADQQLRDALRAADVVAQLDRAHQPRRWSEQSDTVVCDVCHIAFPCAVRTALDGE